jgi:hypothetical protein
MNWMVMGTGTGLGTLLCVAAVLADRYRIRHDRVPGGPKVRAVPHTGPPPVVTLRDTGVELALTIGVALRPGATSVTTGDGPR